MRADEVVSSHFQAFVSIDFGKAHRVPGMSVSPEDPLIDVLITIDQRDVVDIPLPLDSPVIVMVGAGHLVLQQSAKNDLG
jgi:hypothetical protein